MLFMQLERRRFEKNDRQQVRIFFDSVSLYADWSGLNGQV